MKRFVLLHCGFEKPTPEVMTAWHAWFASIADRTVENLGFGTAREISRDGARDLPLGRDSLTGISIVRAESLADAERMARECPFVSSIRVYELRSS